MVEALGWMLGAIGDQWFRVRIYGLKFGMQGVVEVIGSSCSGVIRFCVRRFKAQDLGFGSYVTRGTSCP